MRRLKKINLEDNLAQMFLICEGLYAFATGLLLFSADVENGGSGIYSSLANLMSLDAWAILLLISGVLLIASAFQRGKLKALSMAVSGLLGGVLLLLYGIASFEIVSYTVGIRYIIVSVFMLAVSYFGARFLWTERGMGDNEQG